MVLRCGKPADRGRDPIELIQALRRAAATRPHHTAMIDGPDVYTWAQVADRVARLSAGFASLGIRRGDRVAILANNCAAYYHSLYALFGMGAVAVPLNTRLALPELRVQLEDAGARVLLIGEGYSAQGESLRGAPVDHIVGFGELAGVDTHIEHLIAAHEPAAFAVCGNQDLAGIFYTGGTTGLPKGVMHSHGSLHAMAANLIMQLKLDEDGVVLHSAPMFHLADFAIFVVTMVAGTHVLIRQLDDRSLLDAIEQYGVTHSFTVPVIIDRIARSPDLANRDLSRLKVLGYGGAPMPWGTYLHAREKLPSVDFIQGFGMTEMPSISFLSRRYHRHAANPEKLKSAGVAGYGYELRVVDETGAEVPRGQFGEIIGRGDNLMLGYWNRPEETQAALRDGWMYSGDAGFMDEDGFIYITDRLKDMIVTGGENVYSIEVENVLSAHPSVHECAVIGVPDEKWGERVHAVVTLVPDMTLGRDEMIAFCRQSLAGYKIPRSLEVIATPLPRNGAGKVLKGDLRKQHCSPASSADG
ncbi:putative fatty-acid--CoA ligase [Caenibius tardaugens NBRC 16725]|uniref:3-methylmercaptopropionyl-CoA ligase n=1 Tax=Caenibius tardaugens NBRC 16725 TaxID=1219035 RepID=U2ZR20_9SPHN|nr:long-chain fatty acid--CoA ligase [Caenibius tardaugens]AZI36978.1 fatty-acid--CoA ligase [Caenibius tardaugens NBRC 16725]GAD47804.1 putative fatty-acid--CoA ligase [Caenibius tardaugens NBRC 16725]